MRSRRALSALIGAGLGLVTGLAVLPANDAAAGNATKLFVRSAVEHAGDTVTFPLRRGTSHGHTVYFVVVDASSGATAQRLGVNRSSKLTHLVGTTAAERVRIVGGVIDFPATVNFAPQRRIVPGPAGFPPAVAEAGAVGEAGYSPYIQLPDGEVLNAPQIANGTGRADKVVALDQTHATVTYRETNGFSGGKAVRYTSFDASDPLAAALENSTFAPAMNAAPRVGGDGTDQARASLAAFVNGATGASNPQRQGLNSAILDGLDPLNVLRWAPNQGRYSPLWDVHLAEWTPAAIAAGAVTRQTDFGHVTGLAEHGLVTGPGGTAFGPAGFIVNCPIISQTG
jgi:hypothetical protein